MNEEERVRRRLAWVVNIPTFLVIIAYFVLLLGRILSPRLAIIGFAVVFFAPVAARLIYDNILLKRAGLKPDYAAERRRSLAIVRKCTGTLPVLVAGGIGATMSLLIVKAAYQQGRCNAPKAVALCIFTACFFSLAVLMVRGITNVMIKIEQKKEDVQPGVGR